MKKLTIIAVLLGFIILSFAFVWMKSASLGPVNNFFNRNLRLKLARSPELRSVLSLHFDGDGSTDYLGRRYEKIFIEADVMDTVAAYLPALDKLAKNIERATGKPTSYVVSDKKIPYDRALSDGDIAKLVRRYRSHRNSGESASLYLFFGSRYEREPSLMGSTFEEYGLVIFGETVSEFGSDDSEALINYQASTALHEFGHQLGLPHNDRPDCLMNEAVESQKLWERAEDIITDFCEYEKTLLRKY